MNPKSNILEVAILPFIPGQEVHFEAAFMQAQKIIAGMKGYIKHDLRRCIETPNQYILQIFWETLEDHTIGFRGSSEYQEWKRLLHHFYDPFPVVEHYESIRL